MDHLLTNTPDKFVTYCLDLNILHSIDKTGDKIDDGDDRNDIHERQNQHHFFNRFTSNNYGNSNNSSHLPVANTLITNVQEEEQVTPVFGSWSLDISYVPLEEIQELVRKQQQKKGDVDHDANHDDIDNNKVNKQRPLLPIIDRIYYMNLEKNHQRWKHMDGWLNDI